MEGSAADADAARNMVSGNGLSAIPAVGAGFATVQVCGTDSLPTSAARPRPPSTGPRTPATCGTAGAGMSGTMGTLPSAALAAWISERSSP